MGERLESGATAAPADAATPSLSISHNSTECEPAPLPKLSGSKLRTAVALSWNIEKLAMKFGLEHLGFLTLTFPVSGAQRSIRKAQKRFNSLNTHVLRQRYPVAVVVVERGSQSGHVHFHLLVVCKADIRTGSNFEEFEHRNYRSAPAALKQEWQWLRDTLPRYGFGRHELLPVKSNKEGIARYVGKYIAKSQANRQPGDARAKLVRYSRGFAWHSSQWAWAAGNAAKWRHKLAFLAKECGFSELTEFADKLGPRWAFYLQDIIMQMPEVPLAKYVKKT